LRSVFGSLITCDVTAFESQQGDLVAILKRVSLVLRRACIEHANLSHGPRGDLRLYGQANKRIRWMPWQSEAMKDVAACEKRGGAGNKH
jgi:hypothetical protein